jgi:hypothetical protein
MPFALRKTSATTFEGEAVLDQFIPGDDYGLGPCDWQAFGLDVRLMNGVNIHIGDLMLPQGRGGFVAGTDRFRVAEGLYRGRRAFRLTVWDNDRQLPSDAPRQANDPLPFFAGGYDDPLKPIDPSDFSTYYFVTVTAERMDPSP